MALCVLWKMHSSLFYFLLAPEWVQPSTCAVSLTSRIHYDLICLYPWFSLLNFCQLCHFASILAIGLLWIACHQDLCFYITHCLSLFRLIWQNATDRGSLSTTHNYFSQFSRLEVPGHGSSMAWWGPCSQLITGTSLCLHVVQVAEHLSKAPSLRHHSHSWGFCPPDLSPSQRPQLLQPSPLSVRISTWEFWEGDTGIQIKVPANKGAESGALVLMACLSLWAAQERGTHFSQSYTCAPLEGAVGKWVPMVFSTCFFRHGTSSLWVDGAERVRRS